MGIAGDVAKGLTEGGFSGLRGLIKDVRSAITGKTILSGEEQLKVQEMCTKMDLAALELEKSTIEQQASVVIAEAKGESKLQRNWRPIVMLMFAYIVAHNYIVAPVVQCFYSEFPMLPTPPDLWDLLKIGIGGYVIGRSAEKIARDWRKK